MTVLWSRGAHFQPDGGEPLLLHLRPRRTRYDRIDLAALIDKNHDGVVDYKEFMPVCFSMIVKILSEKVRHVITQAAELRGSTDHYIDGILPPRRWDIQCQL